MYSILNALIKCYNFNVRPDGSLFWGVGSVACGETVTILVQGNMATIKHHVWFWDGGDVEMDNMTTSKCRLPEVWKFIPERVYKSAVRMARR